MHKGGSGANTTLALASAFSREASTCINSTSLIRRLRCDDIGEAFATCAASPDAGLLKATVVLSASARAESGVLHVSLARNMPSTSGEFCRPSFDPTVMLEVLQGSTEVTNKAQLVESRVVVASQTAILKIEFSGFNNETLLTLVLGVLECPPGVGLLNYTLVARLTTSRCFDRLACTRTLTLLPPNAAPLDGTFCTDERRLAFASHNGRGKHAVDVFGGSSHDDAHTHTSNGWIILGLVLALTMLCGTGVVVYTLWAWMWPAAATVGVVWRNGTSKRKK